MYPNTVLLVGAGFSKSIAPNMPTADELGTLVIDRMKNNDASIPKSLVFGSFESWLSRLADRQPYVSEDEYLMHSSFFLKIATEVANIIDERESET